MSRKHRLWAGVLSLLTLCLLVVGFVLNKWMQETNTGTVHTGSPTSAAMSDPQPVTIKTSYFTTTLPAGFSVKRQSENTGGIALLQLMAATPSVTDEQFAVTVGTLPTAGLEDVGDYHLRITQTTTYVPYTPPSLPTGATAFRTATGPPAFVVFWPHEGKYTEIALTTDAVTSLDELQAVFAQAVSSWQWL